MFLVLEHSLDLGFPHPSALLGLFLISFYWLASSFYLAIAFLSLFEPSTETHGPALGEFYANPFTDGFPGDGSACAACFTSCKALHDAKMCLAHFGDDLLDRLKSSCTKIPYSESRFDSWTPLHSCLRVKEEIGIEFEFCRKGFLQNLHKELNDFRPLNFGKSSRSHGNSRNSSFFAPERWQSFCAIMDRVLIGSFDIIAGSQYLLAQVGWTGRTMDCEQALYFSFPLVSRFTLVSHSAQIYRVRPAWLMKRLHVMQTMMV